MSLSGGSNRSPSWRVNCHWDRSGVSCVSSCVIVFSACVLHVSSSQSVRGKIVHISSAGSVSPLLFPVRFGDIYIQNERLSQRGIAKRREASFDLTCYWIVLWPFQKCIHPSHFYLLCFSFTHKRFKLYKSSQVVLTVAHTSIFSEKHILVKIRSLKGGHAFIKVEFLSCIFTASCCANYLADFRCHHACHHLIFFAWYQRVYANIVFICPPGMSP